MTDESHQATHISAAGRLFDIVRDAASRSGATGFLAVFAAVGGAPESDHARGLEVLARVFGLLAEAKEEVLRRPELKQMLYMGAINSVDTVLRTANFSSEWKVVAPQLQQALIALEFCADQLNRLNCLMGTEHPPDFGFKGGGGDHAQVAPAVLAHNRRVLNVFSAIRTEPHRNASTLVDGHYGVLRPPGSTVVSDRAWPEEM